MLRSLVKIAFLSLAAAIRSLSAAVHFSASAVCGQVRLLSSKYLPSNLLFSLAAVYKKLSLKLQI
ncbi:MAG: hypothetical protein LBK52_04600, partial [Deltaproteobacteria bacterium]|nr:hypothetical protein [Deltaproteobacteria bacterium]